MLTAPSAILSFLPYTTGRPWNSGPRCQELVADLALGLTRSKGRVCDQVPSTKRREGKRVPFVKRHRVLYTFPASLPSCQLSPRHGGARQVWGGWGTSHRTERPPALGHPLPSGQSCDGGTKPDSLDTRRLSRRHSLTYIFPVSFVPGWSSLKVTFFCWYQKTPLG